VKWRVVKVSLRERVAGVSGRVDKEIGNFFIPGKRQNCPVWER